LSRCYQTKNPNAIVDFKTMHSTPDGRPKVDHTTPLGSFNDGESHKKIAKDICGQKCC